MEHHCNHLCSGILSLFTLCDCGRGEGTLLLLPHKYRRLRHGDQRLFRLENGEVTLEIYQIFSVVSEMIYRVSDVPKLGNPNCALLVIDAMASERCNPVNYRYFLSHPVRLSTQKPETLKKEYD